MYHETYTRPGLEQLRRILDSSDLEIKTVIGHTQLLIRYFADGDPKPFSNGEKIIQLFGKLSKDREAAAQQCRDLCLELFGISSADSDLKNQMKLIIDLELRQSEPTKGPFG